MLSFSPGKCFFVICASLPLPRKPLILPRIELLGFEMFEKMPLLLQLNLQLCQRRLKFLLLQTSVEVVVDFDVDRIFSACESAVVLPVLVIHRDALVLANVEDRVLVLEVPEKALPHHYVFRFAVDLESFV